VKVGIDLDASNRPDEHRRVTAAFTSTFRGKNDLVVFSRLKHQAMIAVYTLDWAFVTRLAPNGHGRRGHGGFAVTPFTRTRSEVAGDVVALVALASKNGPLTSGESVPTAKWLGDALAGDELG